MFAIDIINGPNLNLLGDREPMIYGQLTWEEYFSGLQGVFSDVEISSFQSNHEGAIIDRLHWCRDNVDAVVLNAGGYSHTSIAIHDAINAINIPVVEVHISNVMKREEFRHHSYISSVALATITGFSLDGYRLAVDGLINYLEENKRLEEIE